MTSNPEFDRLKSVAHSLMSQKQWDAASVVALAGSLAVDVNKIVSLSGSQKKQLVLDVLKSEFQDSVVQNVGSSSHPLAPEAVKVLTYVIDYAVPAALDLALAAARGHLDLKKVKKNTISGFFACFPFLLPGGSPVLVPVSLPAPLPVEKVEEKVKEEEKKEEKEEKKEEAETNNSTDQTDTSEVKLSQQETPLRKNSRVGGVVLRVVEDVPQSDPQTA